MRGLRLLLLAVLTALATVPAGLVPEARAQQEQARPDYGTWADVAQRAEETIASGVRRRGLESLRQTLSDWRSRFFDTQGANSARIETLRSQIDALGPVPEGAEGEPPDIRERRAALARQLEEARAPAVKAEEAYLQADGLIRQIDATIRERQARRLTRLGPSPLMPAIWPEGLAALRQGTAGLWGEIAQTWRTPSGRAALRGNAPALAILATLGLVLILRGRIWFEWLSYRGLRMKSQRGRGVLEFAISTGQVIMPVLGLLALAKAAELAGLTGPRADGLAWLLPEMGVAGFGARWLGTRLFPKSDMLVGALTLPHDQRREGRRIATAIGLILALSILVGATADAEEWSEAARAVVGFPLLLVAGLLLARTGQFLLRHTRTESAAEDGGSGYRLAVIGVVARAAVVLGLLGPVLAVIGYGAGATATIYPAILTLAGLALLNILQQLVADLYMLFTGQDAEEANSLVPVLLGFLLVVLSLPGFALVWGARVAELTELWSRFRVGFTLGDTRITPSDFLTFILVFAAGYVVTRVAQGTLRGSVLPKTKLDIGGRNAIVAGLGYVGIILAALIAVTTAGIDLSSLAIVAGALSVGIGFGLQNIVSNFVSGIILLIERPISEGDWIEVGPNMGYVRDISVRSTRVETFDRTDVIIPNSDLVSGTVTNWTRGNLVGRVIVPVRVAYGSDTRRVTEILAEIAEAHPLVVINPAPAALFIGFGESWLDFEIRAILRDINWLLDVRSEMNHEVARRFAAEGIEIPFPQQGFWLRNPEALSGGARAGAAGAGAAGPDGAAPSAGDPAQAGPTHLTQEDLHSDRTDDADGDI